MQLVPAAVTGGFTKLCRTNVPSATIGQLLFFFDLFFDFFFLFDFFRFLAFGSGWAGADGAALASAGSSVTTGCVIGPVVGR